MSERWATIIKGNDGEEIVSNIAQMEGEPPEIRDDQKKNGTAKVEQVEDGVLIGMIRGGPVDPVGGFGFPEGSAGAQGRGTGVTRVSDSPVSNPDLKSRGNDLPKDSSANGDNARASPAKSAAKSRGKAA